MARFAFLASKRTFDAGTMTHRVCKKPIIMKDDIISVGQLS